MKLKVGDKAPEFEVKDQDGNTVKLADFKGKKVVLYQGLINFEKRCLDELIQAISLIEDKTIVLSIMPMPGTATSLLNQIEDCANKYNVLNRIFILDSLNPPNHLEIILEFLQLLNPI